ncbi:hypothetical protein GUJ93_ZPchr0002g23110 [Zizania palustris]|uniref:Cyclin N-terminal domain-containing protein n=1 Tax=Zizania palustris TaxID=103762 RepID=A0A8J5SFS2_ZIZPA|nr:hypothetical protein GUJ93_ZPchr0002g23110 [Zizania palustris]
MAALSYEMAASILLCAEDSSSIFGFGEEEDVVLAGKRTRCAGTPAPAPEPACVDFAVPSEEYIARLVETEADHMPREDYAARLRGGGGLDLRVRTDALDLIWKVHCYYNFAPLTACLAVNYLDRFLSLYQLPDGKAWMTQLLSVACLSLAAKMEETNVPYSLDLQVGDARHVFEAKTIQRMELLVLSTLKWRMQAVTPFSYVGYFLHQLNGGNAPSTRSVLRSTELILRVARGTKCLDFRPSEIAAAIAAAVAGLGEEDHTAWSHVNKARVSRCREVIQAMADSAVVQPPATASPGGNASASSVPLPRSPTRVLDAAGCLSYRSDDSATASLDDADWGCDTDSSWSVSNKRRKINT